MEIGSAAAEARYSFHVVPFSSPVFRALNSCGQLLCPELRALCSEDSDGDLCLFSYNIELSSHKGRSVREKICAFPLWSSFVLL